MAKYLASSIDLTEVNQNISDLTTEVGKKASNEVFKPSGENAKEGLVPTPPSEVGSSKYLREDGTWETPTNTDTVYEEATESEAGLMSASDKTKLNTIEEDANKTIVDNAISESSTNPVQNKVIKEELDKKANVEHSHTKEDITDFPESMPASDVFEWAKQSEKPAYTAEEVGAIPATAKGSASGVAELDSNGFVLAAQLPSYVDDVIEGYLKEDVFYKDEDNTDNPIEGESGKIYTDLLTNKTYRWGGTKYVTISDTIALGETETTAYRGDKGKVAYEHSQAPHAMVDATKTEASSENGNIKINDNEVTVYIHPGSGTNPHGTTKEDVGLDKVENFKAVSTEANQELSDTEKENARTNIGAGTSSFSGSFNDLEDLPTIDSEMSDESTNAVQNKVVKSQLDVLITKISELTQTVSDNNIALHDAILCLKGKEFTKTLLAGNTSVSFTDDMISDSMNYEIYTNKFGLNAKNVELSEHTLIITFDRQDDDVEVTLNVRNTDSIS